MEGGAGAPGGGDGDTSGGIKENWKVQFGSDIGLIVVLWWLSTPASRLEVRMSRCIVHHISSNIGTMTMETST